MAAMAASYPSDVGNMRTHIKESTRLDLTKLHEALVARDPNRSPRPSRRPSLTPRATPRHLHPLVRKSSNVTDVSQWSLGEHRNSDGHAPGAVRAQPDVHREMTEMHIRVPEGTRRCASLYLSRSQTHAPLDKRGENQSAGEEQSRGEGEQGQEKEDQGDNVPMDMAALERPPLPDREFDFTDYDIMADVPTPPPVRDPAEATLQRHQFVYRASCCQVGVIPTSFVERRLLSQELRVRGYGLGAKGAMALAVALVENDYVRYLDIKGNQIGPTGGKAIAQMLTANSNIEEVHVDENELGFMDGSALCMAIREKDHFRKLSLASNGVKSVDGFYIADMIEHNIYLQELTLSHNQLESNGAIVIGNALATNDTMEVLDLSWNYIRGSSAIAIANGLSKNTGLKVLNLAWNGFGRDGCAALSQALKVNRTLRELDVRCNRVSVEDVAAIMKGLENNRALCTLRLAMNPITPHGALLVLKKMEKMATSALQDLDLNDIAVSSEFVDLMKELKGKRVLRVRHGVTIGHSRSPTQGDEDVGIYSTDSHQLVFKLMEHENLRVVDLFHRLDGGNSFSLTRSEFKAGIMKAGLPITEDQLDRIVDLIDVDGDGTVDLMELLEAEREYNRSKLKRKKRGEREKKIQK